MVLSPGTLLETKGYEHPFRISQVFKRYDGEAVGVTSVWPFLNQVGGQRIVSADRSEVGVALAPVWRDAYLEPDEQQDDASWSPGILTTAFEITSAIDVEFNCNLLSTLSFREAMGANAMVDGRKIGRIAHYTDDIPLETSGLQLRAFPLLRLERDEDDLSDTTIRNGALVKADKQHLVGIIVNRFDRGRSYSVAPIDDVMLFHGVVLASKDDIEGWNSEREAFKEYFEKDYQERFYPGASVDELDPGSQQVRTLKGGPMYAVG